MPWLTEIEIVHCSTVQQVDLEYKHYRKLVYIYMNNLGSGKDKTKAESKVDGHIVGHS